MNGNISFSDLAAYITFNDMLFKEKLDMINVLHKTGASQDQITQLTKEAAEISNKKRHAEFLIKNSPAFKTIESMYYASVQQYQNESKSEEKPDFKMR